MTLLRWALGTEPVISGSGEELEVVGQECDGCGDVFEATDEVYSVRHTGTYCFGCANNRGYVLI